MSLVRTILLVIVSMVALSTATIEAETLTLTVADHGILGTMQRAGCHDHRWLARVMIDSGILESQLNRLPEGTPVVVSEECMSGQAPAHEDRVITRQIFADQLALRQHVPASGTTAGATPPVGNVVPSTTTATTTAVDTKPIVDAIASLKVAMEAERKAHEDSVGWKHTALYSVTPSLLCSLLVCCLLLSIFSRRLPWRIFSEGINNGETTSSSPKLTHARSTSSDRHVSALGEPVPSSIVFHGKMIVFRDTTPVAKPTLGCPFCMEKKIGATDEDMLQHLAEDHVELRVTEEKLPQEALEGLTRVA